MKLEIKNASYSYRNGRPLYEDVSFSVESGEMISILGPNGAGKTTLLRAAMGLLKWTKGESFLDGEPIADMSPSKLWSKIAYVPQSIGKGGSYTVLQSVLLGLTNQIGLFSVPKEKDILFAEETLGKLNILHLRDRKCNEISGGELQMVMIARSLVSRAGIMILDEPESNLDFKNQMIVLDTLTRLCNDGIGILFNTHYPEHALRRSSKSILIDNGSVLFGPTPSIITEKNIESAFGVKAYIGQFETDQNMIANVIPVGLAEKADKEEKADSEDEDVLATLSIICRKFSESGRINALLHEYNDILFGRMGMPHRKRDLYLISINLDGNRERIRMLEHQLSMIPDVSCKITYAKEDVL